jgi:uncharacterized damage-inducible protein DinB
MSINPEETLIELIRYNNWANAQILAFCQELTPEQLAATVPGTYGAIHETLWHMIHAEADYIGRLTGERPQPPFTREEGPSVAEIFAFSSQVADALLDAVRRISPTQLVHEEEDGNFIDYHARHLFIQTINHGIEHRTNITTILSSLGLPTPEVDGWGYLMTHPEKFDLMEGSLNG